MTENSTSSSVLVVVAASLEGARESERIEFFTGTRITRIEQDDRGVRAYDASGGVYAARRSSARMA